MKERGIIILWSVLMFFLVTSGCRNTIANLESKPTALGKTGEIVVISDADIWNGQVGDSIVYYYESPYPIMPQPEPMFDLRHFTTEDIRSDALRKELRTYLIVADLTDEDSPTSKMIRNDLGPEKVRRFTEDPDYYTTVGQDKWARNQLVIYVFGRNEQDLAEKVIRSFPRVAKRVNEHDQVQVDAATYLDGESVRLSNLISDKFGVAMKVPGDFNVAIEDDGFLWIRKDTRELTMSIAIKTFPYVSEEQLEKEGLINMRDRLGLRIEGSSLGSYMRTNAEDLPVYTYQREFDGRYTIESRGIWELTEDYMGGPFVNYAIVDGDRILMIDCFVFAPGKSKRKYVKQLVHVISSLDFVES